MALEMEGSGSEDAVRVLQRRPGGADLRILSGADEARVFFKRRAFSVGAERLAEGRGPGLFYGLGGLAGSERASQNCAEAQEAAAIRTGISWIEWHKSPTQSWYCTPGGERARMVKC